MTEILKRLKQYEKSSHSPILMDDIRDAIFEIENLRLVVKNYLRDFALLIESLKDEARICDKTANMYGRKEPTIIVERDEENRCFVFKVEWK